MNEYEIREGLAFVEAELRAIHEAAGDAPLAEDAQARFDEGVTFVNEKRAELERIEARKAEVARLAANPTRVESERSIPESVNVNTRTAADAFDLSSARFSSRADYSADLAGRVREIAERAAPSWADDERRESLARLAERETSRNYDADQVNEYLIRTGSPAYVEAFRSYLKHPEFGPDQELRAAMSLTAANGGVLVPQWLDPTIVLTNAGTQNDVRRISRVEQVTVDQADFVTSAGVTAEWLGEGSEAADATPTFAGPTITNYKGAAWLFGSYEMLADSGFNAVSSLIADAKDRLEAAAFVNGTGSSQPKGLITALSGTGPVVTGSSGAAGAADFVAADVYALSENLGARFRKNASFLSSHTFYNDIRQLGTSNTYHAFWTSFGGGTPSQLIGYPVYHAEEMDSTVVSGSNDYVLLLGDFQHYCITDRIGTTIMFEPMVKSTSNGRPSGQAGWFAFFRTGADVLTSSAFKLLKL